MSEPAQAEETRPPQTAGEMLRSARQRQGLHIAALATVLKVAPRKLEALESDRHEELQGPTFVRALAQAACRALKIDPTPVLARLPDANGNTLDQVNGGLNAPFRERGTRRQPSELPLVGQGILALVALLLVGAAAMWLVPAGWSWSSWWPQAASASSAPEPASAPAPIPANPVPALAAQPQAAVTSVAMPAALAAAPGSEGPSHLLHLRATAASWVDVNDGSGQSLLSRTLQPGEAVDLDGALPLRIKIGNASGTELSFRGQALDLAPSTHDNVARLELK